MKEIGDHFLQEQINMSMEEPVRNTQQEVMPMIVRDIKENAGYDIYPFQSLGTNKVFNGFHSLGAYIINHKIVLIDGYVGVNWKFLKAALSENISAMGYTINWIDTDQFLKQERDVDMMAEPFLGEENSVWGTRTDLILEDFFDIEKLRNVELDQSADINIAIGTGAAFVNWEGQVLYADLPKNELQHRMNAGSVTNLGKRNAEEPTSMYKRFYFVDWIVLNQHKENILNTIAVFIDAQWPTNINWAHADDIRSGLKNMSSSVFRVRPWFAPGAWGGQWMKKHMPQLDQHEVNYAWSFELIVPENGIVFESDGNLLELSFDLLMFSQNKNILGRHSGQFKNEFPIRFDFLDTFDGGNLSIQCHPSLAYIQEKFGEQITQDETYYILDCQKDAKVYLGFQEDINAGDFRNELENSNDTGKILEIEKYVQVHEAKKHDLFLIPNGTVHSAGAGNLVLEISATPYIFTFKMYDWVRLDLNGKPRPINIDHAFNNLNFDRKGEKVADELISKPYLLSENGDAQVYHLPTHNEHFYDVHRHEFQSEILIHTENVCHILMLVEGSAVTVESTDGTKMNFQYAETFVVPAAAGSYKLINQGPQRAKVIKAFLK